MSETIKEVIKDMLTATQETCAYMLEGLPRTATTDAQKELQTKHGTPYEFGQACINALDMISPKEAQAAIDKYALEWSNAK